MHPHCAFSQSTSCLATGMQQSRRGCSALLCVCCQRQPVEQKDSSEIFQLFEHISSYQVVFPRLNRKLLIFSRGPQSLLSTTVWLVEYISRCNVSPQIVLKQGISRPRTKGTSPRDICPHSPALFWFSGTARALLLSPEQALLVLPRG